MLLALADCGVAPDDGERYTFVAPDNQTGDASFDWATHVVHRGLSAAVGFGAAADTLADARLVQSANNRIVYSTLTRAADESRGEVRLHSVVFDEPGHQFNREFTVTGNVLQVINRMATTINSEARELGVKSEEALRKWPVLTGDMAEYESKCAELPQSEPSFGAALASCAEQLAARRRIDSLRTMLSRIPADQSREFAPEAIEAIGNGHMAVKDYAGAAVIFRQGVSARPGLKNMVGYSEALAGHYEIGKQALEEYARQPNQEANALDSLGEISFLTGRYKEAELYFLASEPKWIADPHSQLEPVKAAAARLLAGDAAGANQLAKAQFDKLGKSNPQGAATLKQLWTSISGAATPEARRQLIENSLIRRP